MLTFNELKIGEQFDFASGSWTGCTKISHRKYLYSPTAGENYFESQVGSVYVEVVRANPDQLKEIMRDKVSSLGYEIQALNSHFDLALEYGDCVDKTAYAEHLYFAARTSWSLALTAYNMRQ